MMPKPLNDNAHYSYHLTAVVYLISTISWPCDLTAKAKRAVAVKMRYILQHPKDIFVAMPPVLQM